MPSVRHVKKQGSTLSKKFSFAERNASSSVRSSSSRPTRKDREVLFMARILLQNGENENKK